MVKIVSELESRVKNYRKKLKSKKMDLHACMRHVGGGHMVGWLAVSEMEVGMWLVGWLG
jgi:hypothetical protein